MRHVNLIGSVVEDERQLDGSRHIEIVGDEAMADLALRLVVDRDGSVREAELDIELDGLHSVIGFDQSSEAAGDEQFSFHLLGPGGAAEVVQQDDGEISLRLQLADAGEGGE
ncbi:MAG: hypothetical protein F4038_02570 [Chloroflexi bacterium]|nr:hypothetical protein [Chloroflexota bacterium]MXY86341.1 hypothetical protein [Chloroflexota bacterium]MYA01871.1 hypothetical protein [Chloroflexota bacterium]MYC02961.1 hypothetical protein [Chloroflexota bacterium]MYD73417.1 hypothetical protein [Chloroflexota bacterium]